MAVMDGQTRTGDVLDVPRGRKSLERAMPDVVQLAETTSKALLNLPGDALTALFKTEVSVRSDHLVGQSAERIAAEIDIIDTWAMTIETLAGTYTGSRTIELPVRPYMALRMRVLEA